MQIKPKQLIAHRGYRERYPENSLLGVSAAISCGAVNIEVDVQFSKDGEPVLYHDANMLRVSGVEHALLSLSSEEIKSHSAYEPERLGQAFNNNPIEMLSQLLPIIHDHPHVHFFIDLKEDGLQHFGREACFHYLCRVLSPMPDNCVLISFDVEAVLLAKRFGFKKTALVFRDWNQRREVLAESNADMGFINQKYIPEGDIIEASVPMVIYESCELEVITALIARGAYAVETFCIGKLIASN